MESSVTRTCCAEHVLSNAGYWVLGTGCGELITGTVRVVAVGLLAAPR